VFLWRNYSISKASSCRVKKRYGDHEEVWGPYTVDISNVVDLDPDSQWQNGPQTNIKKLMIFFFFNAGCSILRAEGFSCSFHVLQGGLGISKLQFLIKKYK
jgi:hypothetical protein